MDHLDLVLVRGEGCQVNAGDRRHEVPAMAACVTGYVVDDDANSHGCFSLFLRMKAPRSYGSLEDPPRNARGNSVEIQCMGNSARPKRAERDFTVRKSSLHARDHLGRLVPFAGNEHHIFHRRFPDRATDRIGAVELHFHGVLAA